MRVISATEAARSFSDVLNRVKHRGEEFVVVRGGEEVARISPVPEARTTLGELVELIGTGRKRDLTLARDLERIQRDQPKLAGDPWRSD